MRKTRLLLLLLLYSIGAYSQGYVDQKAIAPLINDQGGDIAGVHLVAWHRYIFDTQDLLKAHLDTLPGAYTRERQYIIELANRVTTGNMQRGRVLLVPGFFEKDYKSYAPYPLEYAVAAGLPKLFIIDKCTQTFAAYEYGKLMRWGLVSTGRKNNLTPVGRYNFNWKARYRKSAAAPPGEVWELYWMFDFHAKFGIHVHQYQLPIAAAVSHGCVRTAEADAIWNYNWANGWLHDRKNRLVRNGTPLVVINANPPAGRASHWAIQGNEIVSLVRLPLSFDEIPLGTIAQKQAPWESGW
jgi:hypothetical protein